MKTEKEWRIITTNVKCEQELVRIFLHKGIQSFCPQQHFTILHEGQIVSGKKPLFTSMLFVYISDKEFKTILETGKVTGFLYWMNSPAIVPHYEISDIYYFTNSYSNIQLEKCDVKKSSRSTNSSLSEDGAGNIIIQLNSMGYRMTAKQENFNVNRHLTPIARGYHRLQVFSFT